MEQQSKVGATIDRHINVILCSHLMCQLIRTQQAHPAIIILIPENKCQTAGEAWGSALSDALKPGRSPGGEGKCWFTHIPGVGSLRVATLWAEAHVRELRAIAGRAGRECEGARGLQGCKPSMCVLGTKDCATCTMIGLSCRLNNVRILEIIKMI